MKGNLWMEIRSEKKKGLSYAEIGRKHHIDALLGKDNYSAALILERIRERGCQCSYTIVKDYVSQKKKKLNSKVTVRFETVPGLQGQVVIKRLLKQSESEMNPKFVAMFVVYSFVYEIDYSELKQYNRALSQINNNINQIARKANTFDVATADDIKQVKEMMDKIWHIILYNLLCPVKYLMMKHMPLVKSLLNVY